MNTRKHSKSIKKRFVYAVECIAKERYPNEREVNIIRSLGFTPANYYRLRATENNYPTLDQCVILCEKYGYSPYWLLLNKGPLKHTISAKVINPTPKELMKQALVLMNGHK